MVNTGIGSTPNSLQATILKSLLASKKDTIHPASISDSAAKEILEPLKTAIFGDRRDAKMTYGGCKPITENWWQALEPDDVLIAFSDVERDKSACFFSLPLMLISNQLSDLLGGTGSISRQTSSARLSRTEKRYVEYICDKVWQAIQPLTQCKPGKFSVFQISDPDASDQLKDLPGAMVHCAVRLGDQTHSLSIIIPDTSLIPAPDNLAQTLSAGQNKHSKVAEEIGRTQIRAEIMFRLADQTLERLRSLRPGDLFDIAPASLDKAKVVVRGHEVFAGQIGRAGQNYSFKVANSFQGKSAGLMQIVSALSANGDTE